MRKRKWWFAGLALALLAACVGVWNLGSMPPENPNAEMGISEMEFATISAKAPWFQRLRVHADISRRPHAYADLVVRYAKQRKQFGMIEFRVYAPLAFYDALAGHARDPDWKVRATCLGVLLQSGQFGPRWQSLVSQSLQDENQAVVDWAVLLSGAMGSPSAPETRVLVRSTDPKIRLAAARALTKVATLAAEGKDDLDALRALSRDSNAKVRAQALFALRQVGVKP